MPRIVGPIRRLRPVEVRDVEFMRANTDRMIKITVPGPFTMSRQAKSEFYKDEEELVMNYAAAVRDLKAVGRCDPARRALTAALPTGERQPTCPRFWGRNARSRKDTG
jgi:hypothetical protein